MLDSTHLGPIFIRYGGGRHGKQGLFRRNQRPGVAVAAAADLIGLLLILLFQARRWAWLDKGKTIFYWILMQNSRLSRFLSGGSFGRYIIIPGRPLHGGADKIAPGMANLTSKPGKMAFNLDGKPHPTPCNDRIVELVHAIERGERKYGAHNLEVAGAGGGNTFNFS